MISLTGRPTGTVSTFADVGPSGYSKFHIHCFAVT